MSFQFVRRRKFFLVANFADEADENFFAVNVVAEVVDKNFQPSFHRFERGIVADVGNAVEKFAANFHAHDVSTVGQHCASVVNFDVRRGETELATAFVAVDDLAGVSEISAQKFIGTVQVALSNQRPNSRGADGFSVDGERGTNFRLEAVIVALAQEKTSVAATETPESVIGAGDDEHGSKFVAQEFQKFFG